MDCSGKKKSDILRIATIPGNTQILKLSGNGLNSDEDLVEILKLKVRKVMYCRLAIRTVDNESENF